jgi:uncharacterized repeat protein (TIGR03803 family)
VGANGNMFGTVPRLGPGGGGLVFELTPANGSWKEGTASAFLGTDAGVPSNSGLIFDSSGSLYGETVFGGSADQGSVFKMTPNSQGGWAESVLYSFKNSKSGIGPQGGLVFDTQGSLYGTASGGSISSSCAPFSCGVVFKLTPSGTGWAQSVIHAFSGADGSEPNGPLVFDAAGNLYGTTFDGGAFDGGTVFKLAPSSGGTWTETVLYNFPYFTSGTDGSFPSGGVVFDQAGNLYGTTAGGGVSGLGCGFGCGTVFKLTSSSGGAWTETVLYLFTNGLDGSRPQGPLALDAAGNLYGTTPTSSTGYGTVFRLSPSGGSWTLSTLHGFASPDGPIPGPVILDAAGNLYGTTTGSNTGYGTVFQLTPGSSGWTEMILYAFTGYPLDGASPTGSLTRDAAGNLYGNTALGSPTDQGIVFEIVP